ncbi:helix-turn-helix domain-containing protein [Actinomadura harenae]|uniref:XRE family transcriptional regulator n=1 Tax=Actinomadura harenae TaxID=2483351 RepID=A0A3M2MFH7_9ACTN|nr:helix-turn-helix transcriptional regulator [Actinomadura harenae]RMI47623.1 XRE family transcriptional regulator [Actinomadura harenae]
MPSSSSSSAQRARQQLADQLRELRQAAGLSGVDFARQAGWRDSTKVSQIERGSRPASPADVRLWCRLTGASPHREAELLAEQRAAAGMWQTHQQLNRAGLKARQEKIRDKYWRVRRHLVYQTKYIPGLLQTQALTTHYLTTARLEQHLDLDDVADAVRSRMDRQRCLERPDARWLFLLEEDVLWYRPAPVDVHIEQLEHLLDAMQRPTVSLGVIPRNIDRHGVNPEESFTMSELPDAVTVAVELVSGTLTLTQPYETQMYAEAWARLFGLAVHGDHARALIRASLEVLRSA